MSLPHEEKLSGSSGTNKRQKIAQDLINSIDQTGELLAMFEDNELDDVKQERMEVWHIHVFPRGSLPSTVLSLLVQCP